MAGRRQAEARYQNGTIDLEHDIKGAERAVERISPGHNILQEVRRGDHELDVGFKVAEEAVEGMLNGSNLRQDLASMSWEPALTAS